LAGTNSDLSIVVIIPLYNGAPWIEQSIASVFSQTLQPDEFIVVDDGSIDEGPGIVEQWAQNHPIRLLRKPNGGQSSARNFGVAHSKSALIALLDQDDIWYPDHLEALVGAFNRRQGPPLGWAYSDFDDIDIDGKTVSRSYASLPKLENPKRRLTTILGQGIIIQPSATLISRAAFEAVGGFDERLCGYEDDDLFLRIFRACYDNVYIPYSTAGWRIHATSRGTSDRHDNSLRFYIRKLLHEFPDDLLRGNYYARDMIAPRFIKTWIVMYIRAMRYKNHAKMREYIDDALALLPILRFRRRIFYALVLPLLRFPSLGPLVIFAGYVARRALSLVVRAPSERLKRKDAARIMDTHRGTGW
jgi:glycosyltransferase involved in cell wall biosynthesis